MKQKVLLLLSFLGMMSTGAEAQRYVDKLDRGIVAVPGRSSGMLVSWRIFGDEYYDVEYNLYRNGTKVNSTPLKVSNYEDKQGTSSSKYQVAAVVRGVEQEKSAEVKAWSQNYLTVKVQPVVNRAGKTIANSVAGNSGGTDTTTPGYTLNDISLADVDGDGVCEFMVKRNNSQGNLNKTSNTTDFNLYECYKMDGTRLWWIDLGPNLMSNPDEQYDMIGYDWDRDGKAEFVMRGADNMIIHTATGKTINIGDMTYDSGKGSDTRPEYVATGAEYLLYLNGATGEPYGWNGEENWTPAAFPLPRFESNETDGDAAVWGDVGHRATKIYMGAPYLDGRHASIFFGRGCYTRHKACALDVDPNTHQLTQRWRWNCYDSKSPWFGNGFHNFAIADVDMDGRDEIVYGSMILDDTGYGLATSGLGHGDAQHCGDLDPYRWGLEQFTCQEGSEGNSYWNATTGEMYYRKQDGGDDGRALAGNFTNDYPGAQGKSATSSTLSLVACKYLPVNGISNLNNRIYWDGDLLDEMFDSKNGANRAGNIFKWNGNVIATFTGISNNWTKCNPSAQGDILGDWREEMVLRLADNSAFHVYTTNYPTQYRIPTLWHDHEYRNGMAWQCVGYNQPPHVSFFLGELEGITVAPPPTIMTGRTEILSGGTISSSMNDKHVLFCEQKDAEITVVAGAQPWVFTDNAPVWIQGSGDRQATSATPKSPARTYIYYTHTVKGAAFTGSTRVIKQGEGTLVLPAVEQTYTGETNVWNGTLKFDGKLVSSPLWLNRHTNLLTDGGQFMGGIQADYNATITIGENKKSTLTASTLALNFGSRVIFDLYSDITCDQITANTIKIESKDWAYGPKYHSPVFEFHYDGTLADGQYLLANATVEGDLDEVVLEGIGDRRNMLKYEDGKLYLVVETFRQPATISWMGQQDNVWDFGITENFMNNGKADYAGYNDDITFGDDAQQTAIRVKGGVSPKTVTFNNSEKDYTLTGDSIMNGATITKNGTGTVTILTENRTGNTVVNGGTLKVNFLANSLGQTYGALGDASKTITLNNGSTLALTETAITDQQVNVSGEVSVDVPSGKAFSLNKGFKSSDTGILHKTGAGTMTLGAANTIAKLVVDGGRVNTIAVNNVDQFPADIVIKNGVVSSTTMDDLPGRTINANFEVPEGGDATFYGPYRGTINGKLTGAGKFKVYSGGIRCYWNGDWSAFEGTLIPALTNRQAKPSYDPTFDWNNDFGLAKATLQVDEGVTFNYAGHTMTLGNVTGKGTISGTAAVVLGTRNEDINFEGEFNGVAVQKVGTGIWNINSTHKQPSIARIFVNGGMLYITSLFNSTSYINTGATITVNNGGTLIGTALIPNACNIYEGGTLTVGRMNSEDMSGEMKFSKTLNLRAGSTLNLNIRTAENATASRSFLTVGTTLTMNGVVNVTMSESYEPKAGDEIVLWTANSFTGTPTVNLPELPAGLFWDTSALLTKEGKLKVSATDGIDLMPDNVRMDCIVYNMSGQQVADYAAKKADVLKKAQKQGLSAGTYIIRMQVNGMKTSQKIIVR